MAKARLVATQAPNNSYIDPDTGDDVAIPGTAEETLHVMCGKGIEVDVAFNKLPINAVQYVLAIGLRNVLMDCHASINRKAHPELSESDVFEQSKAMVEKKLAALMAGEVRAAPRGRSSNEQAKEVQRLGRLDIETILKAKGWKLSDPKVKAGIGGLVRDYVIKNADALNARARDSLAAAKAAAEGIDLDL